MSVQITKMFLGIIKGTTLWITSVRNEIDRILTGVLTAEEGAGLDVMAADHVKSGLCCSPKRRLCRLSLQHGHRTEQIAGKVCRVAWSYNQT